MKAARLTYRTYLDERFESPNVRAISNPQIRDSSPWRRQPAA